MESAIEQAEKQIEQNLKDCTCKDLVVSLLRRHPDSSADFVLLSEQINQDRQSKPSPSEKKQVINEVINGYCTLPQVSVLSPKGRYDVIFSDKSMYFKTSSKVIELPWENVASIISTPNIESKSQNIYTFVIKDTFKIGKKEVTCISIVLDTTKNIRLSFSETQNKESIQYYQNTACYVFEAIIKRITSLKILTPNSGLFKSSLQNVYFKAYYKMNPCTVFPLPSGLLILSNTTDFLQGTMIKMLRTESIAKNSFDYVIELKSKMIYTISMVPIEELYPLGVYSSILLKSYKKTAANKVLTINNRLLYIDGEKFSDENSSDEDDSNFSVDLPSGDLSSSDSEDEDVTSEDDASTVSSEDSEKKPLSEKREVTTSSSNKRLKN